MNRDVFFRFGIALLLLCWSTSLCARQGADSTDLEQTYLNFHKIPEAQELSRGEGIKIAILDWMFDLSSPANEKYVDPVSLVPGQNIGMYKPWHGEWMAQIVHSIAPAAKIIPMRAQPSGESVREDDSGERPFQKYLIRGIRLAADRGAAVVTNSMGPVKKTKALTEAIQYAASRGTIFIDVHPEYMKIENGSIVLCDSAQLNDLIIHCGIVAVPEHPVNPDNRRDIYCWPYQIKPVYKDGWGYSNGPPMVGGVVALMKSVNKGLTVREVKSILIGTARFENGFKVLDAETAVQKALMMTAK